MCILDRHASVFCLVAEILSRWNRVVAFVKEDARHVEPAVALMRDARMHLPEGCHLSGLRSIEHEEDGCLSRPCAQFLRQQTHHLAHTSAAIEVSAWQPPKVGVRPWKCVSHVVAVQHLAGHRESTGSQLLAVNRVALDRLDPLDTQALQTAQDVAVPGANLDHLLARQSRGKKVGYSERRARWVEARQPAESLPR